MSAVLNGATIAIELYYSSAWHDLTCETTSATYTWGAPEALGPLTECEGGTLRVSLYDPDRKWDPDNPSSPLLGVLKVGLAFRVTVDGSPAWTGVLQTWSWDRASTIADLNGIDPIGMLSFRKIPAGTTLQQAPDQVTSAEQAQFLLDLVEWPSAQRYFPTGTAGARRGNENVEGSALDGLHVIRFAELGRLFPMRDGRIGWTSRAGPTPPASAATINCGGVGLTDLWRAMGLGRLRNRVVLLDSGQNWGPVLPPDEYRTVSTTSYVLGLAQSIPFGVNTDDIWAQTILDALNPPPVLTMLGTMIPEDAEVGQILRSEFGARWTVKVTGQPDTLVTLIGMTVTLEPGILEVDAVTEDVVTPKPVIHTVPVTGSGHLLSESGVNYANARAGPATQLFTSVSVGSSQQYVGQYLQAGPFYGVHEAFVAFDTTAIPAGATVTRAVLAAQIVFDWPGPTGGYTWTDFKIQARSYPSGGWRPTLALADWIAGANLGTYPVRAEFDTVRAKGHGSDPGGGSFEFTDAGSGLIGAIKKAGTTELVLVSSRTVAGSGPASTNAYEDVRLEYLRLRVYYQ